MSGTEVEPTGDGVTDAQIHSYKRRVSKALATTYLSLGDEQLSLLRSSKTAMDAWTKMENLYQVKSLANKLFLRKKYFATPMSPIDNMMEHVNKLKPLAEQLGYVGAPVSEDDQVATLLCSLPESKNNLILALQSRAEEFVPARLLHEENKRIVSATAATEILKGLWHP